MALGRPEETTLPSCVRRVWGGGMSCGDYIPPRGMKGPDPLPRTEDQPIRHPLLGSESWVGMKEVLVSAVYLRRLFCCGSHTPAPGVPRIPSKPHEPPESFLNLTGVHF